VRSSRTHDRRGRLEPGGRLLGVRVNGGLSHHKPCDSIRHGTGRLALRTAEGQNCSSGSRSSVYARLGRIFNRPYGVLTATIRISVTA